MRARDSTRGADARIHVVVTCTNRKTLPVPPELRLDSLPDAPAEKRAKAWTRRLGMPGIAEPIEAVRLYAGEHWKIARSIAERVAQPRACLWVCSAGYGLVSAAAPLRPYSAAFSGSDDRVLGGAEGARRWWRALASWEGPQPGQPRTIASLAAAHSEAVFVLALSAQYLDACRDDITAAAAELADPDRFLLISAGSHGRAGLAEVMVPTDARLQASLGGTRQALNARIAAQVLSAGISSRAQAVRFMAELLETQPPIPRYERKKLTDEEISQMIAERLAQAPGLSASTMLREFRDDGHACEQHRFTLLHRAVAAGGTT